MSSAEEVQQAMQTQISNLAQQISALTAGLQRANTAYEAQQSKNAELESKLAAAELKLSEASKHKEKDLIHPSHVPKPQVYDGKKEGWEKFKHVFTAWCSTVHPRYPELLSKHGSSKDPVDGSAFSEEETRLSRAMYTFLMQYCPEPTMNVVGQGFGDENGFEVWRRLTVLSEPAHRTKAWVWRRHLSNPTFPTDLGQWSTALHQWEAELREFERTFKTPFSSDEKISIIAHVAPKELQQSIFTHSDALDTYDKIRNYVEQYLINRNLWKRPQGSQFGITKVSNKVAEDDGGPRPMDIGALDGKGNKGGKEGKGGWKKEGRKEWEDYRQKEGKGKSKEGKGKTGKDGKGKGSQNKGKDSKGKGGKDKKGKGKDTSNPHAGKRCHLCNKYGHIAANCWWKVGSVEDQGEPQGEPKPEGETGQASSSNAVGSVSTAPAERVVKWSDEDVIFSVGSGEVMVSAVGADGDFKYLLVDSGACESVAKKGDFSAEVDAKQGKPLYSVQGQPLRVYGRQFPTVEVGNMTGKIAMTVTDAAESLVAVESLVARGHKVHFEPGGSYLITAAGDTVPLEKHGKRWYLRVKNVDGDRNGRPGCHSSNRVAPVDDDEQWAADTWRREEKDGEQYLVRVHNTARNRLFDPSRVKEIPVPLGRLAPGRYTKLVTLDGDCKEEESVWTNKRMAAKDMGARWLGQSWFKLVPEQVPDAEAAEAAAEQARGKEANERAFRQQLQKELMGDDEDEDEDLLALMNAEGIEGEKEETGPQQLARPKEPSAQERAEHNLHHANFEPWCETCVAGQGRSKQHRRKKEDPKDHIIYSDYMFFTRDGKLIDKEEGKKEKGLVTVLTAICKDSQMSFATVVPMKGNSEYAVKSMTSWIKNLGWPKVIIQVDQEGALQKLYDKVIEELADKAKLRKSPRYSSASLADGEMLTGLVAGKARTWMAEISKSYGEQIKCDHALFPWIVRHCAWTLNRFHINKSGVTAFKVISGHDYVGELIPLGETTMGKYPKVKDKSAPRWVKGIYAGKTTDSDEHILLTEAGAQITRTVRKLPRGSEYQIETLNKARGLPSWNRLLGMYQALPEPEKSQPEAKVAQEVQGEELFGYEDKVPLPSLEPLIIPAPLLLPEAKPQAEEPEGKRQKLEHKAGDTAKTPGDTGGGQGSGGAQVPETFNIGTPPDQSMGGDSMDSSMYAPSMPGNEAQNMVSAISNGEEWNPEGKVMKHDLEAYRAWINQHREDFRASTVANVMDYLDTLGATPEDLKKARNEELRKLNDVFGAFTPRDRRALPRELTVFGHRMRRHVRSLRCTQW